MAIGFHSRLVPTGDDPDRPDLASVYGTRHTEWILPTITPTGLPTLIAPFIASTHTATRLSNPRHVAIPTHALNICTRTLRKIALTPKSVNESCYTQLCNMINPKWSNSKSESIRNKSSRVATTTQITHISKLRRITSSFTTRMTPMTLLIRYIIELPWQR
jgi:hypothetical protein